MFYGFFVLFLHYIKKLSRNFISDGVNLHLQLQLQTHTHHSVRSESMQLGSLEETFSEHWCCVALGVDENTYMSKVNILCFCFFEAMLKYWRCIRFDIQSAHTQITFCGVDIHSWLNAIAVASIWYCHARNGHSVQSVLYLFLVYAKKHSQRKTIGFLFVRKFYWAGCPSYPKFKHIL